METLKEYNKAQLKIFSKHNIIKKYGSKEEFIVICQILAKYKACSLIQFYKESIKELRKNNYI